MKLVKFIIGLRLETGNILLVGTFFLTTGDLGDDGLAVTFAESLFLTIGDREEDDLKVWPVLVKCLQLFFPFESLHKTKL